MKISSRPQTSIRMVSKKFRALYPLEDKLNSFIERSEGDTGGIDTLQLFFDTDLTDADEVNVLDLKGGILQVETSLNWDEFSQLGYSEQQVEFINKIYVAVKKVVEVYSLSQDMYDEAFKELLNEIK